MISDETFFFFFFESMRKKNKNLQIWQAKLIQLDIIMILIFYFL